MAEAIIGLIGVALGFVLSVVCEQWKSARQRKELKAGLYDELRANLLILNQKRDLVQQILQHLEEAKLLPGNSVHFLSVFYKTHFPAVFPDLSVKERNSFHILYEYFRVVDSTLDGYSEQLVESMGTEKVDNYIRLYAAMMTDILRVLGLSEGLIKKHLNGDPEDVFYLATSNGVNKVNGKGS